MASSVVLAAEALNTKATDTIFLENEPLFVDVCARWISSPSQVSAKLAAFGRIIPFAPHLAEHVEYFLTKTYTEGLLGPASDSIPEGELCELLLAVFRLLSFDDSEFAKYIRPLKLQELLSHSSKIARYLTARILCLYLHASDAAMEELISKYVHRGLDSESIHGEWEGIVIDYRFFSLWEEKRSRQLSLRRKATQATDSAANGLTQLRKDISHLSLDVYGVLLPRLDGPPGGQEPCRVVSVPTTTKNLKDLAIGLLDPSPLLLTGLPGSGKTLLVRHLAWHLRKLSSMVTLHLNEQSDAKLLLGMYATGAKPGTFSWRPGVLTTAVREGRWIFIEDLDRAPNEVISTLLPLIERGELLIPSRGETIRAARGFKIIATLRTTLNSKGEELVPRSNMIGYRFWRTVGIHMASLEEFREVIAQNHRAILPHIPAVLRVYSRLQQLYREARFASENGTSLRALTPRDLLKWCDRLSALLAGTSSFTSENMDDIFMEAFDCFAGSLHSDPARARVMAYVAEELHIDPQRRDHLLSRREVRFEVNTKITSLGVMRIGRSKLPRHRKAIANRHVSARPFSTNEYTLRLLEKIAVAVDRKEPLLLVGETGTGKTTCIQFLADQLGRKLVPFNLSQQSESGDLLGGYKPVNIRSLVIPMKDEFDALFDATFSRKRNHRFVEVLGKQVAKGEWKRVCKLWREALRMLETARMSQESRASSEDAESEQPKKKRKVDSLPADFPKSRWDKFAIDLNNLEAQLSAGSEGFAFSFLEGNIVKAVRNGDWVLLDEINLATSDTLEALTDLLGGGSEGRPSILLTETGNVERVVAHPDFRVFAAMNPATDVGKKDLPPGIRSRFTELYVESPDSDVRSLRSIVEKYLGGDSTDPGTRKIALDVTELYLEIQRLAKSNLLVDGADQQAHFSLRTLTRALSYARETVSLCTLRRALFEGFNMSFLTFLSRASEDVAAPLIKKHLFNSQSSIKTELGKPLKKPDNSRSYVQEGSYWLRQGPYPIEDQSHYIITPFIRRNMNNLIRAASTRRYPVLIQGPTSSGKTSMIEYLAKRSGNKFVRINNHEHTDLQEYLGTYISGADGKLVFQEGILVRALREGHWIVLDELNLAPTDVLEALNRLLDDNRELLIPETQEVVRPHEDFMLFATQNPAGLYGGRKALSRAFRNRFLELHFDDIPVEELTEILRRRTQIPESWCKRIVKVYEELSMLRQENRLFEQKSFATLRDLFRWALRKAESLQDLAVNGYMLLAERVRKPEERQAVKRIIEAVMSKAGARVSIDEGSLYSVEHSVELRAYRDRVGTNDSAVWTGAMRRLFVLVAHAISNNEPVLLVGDTGCGKTTVCQLLAEAFGKQLHIVNAHQNTETGDLIGAQRPIRNRAAIESDLHRRLLVDLDAAGVKLAPSEMNLGRLLALYDQLDYDTLSLIPIDHREEIKTNRTKAAALFEWADGSLVHAMKEGQFFLLDEISLADDSVLERLNSVLEPQRTLLLAEKGPIDSLIVGYEGFQFLATMNPGGDYGKKELSPALRNRFTEIWVPSLSDVNDIVQIVRAKLKLEALQYAESIVSFAQWFNDKYNTSVTSSISIRDTLAWVNFINGCQSPDTLFGVVHGAAMVFVDTLGANPAGLLAISSSRIDVERQECLHHLGKLLGIDASQIYYDDISITVSNDLLTLGSFSIAKAHVTQEDQFFSLEAPTTRSNAMRVVRALQLSKPILLEGNPGVGKTTLVTAIARAVGRPLARLNLSEQTDLMDLFGSDIPIEGAQAGTFAWRDAPFLKAMKRGEWVLLDEMNLASQSVLEGLNAVLDHRGEVYISELDQTFHKHPDFRVFAAQNPHHQGGGRKGLPASFVNRFTVVYADIFKPEDLMLICKQVYPQFDREEASKLITFVAELDEQVVNLRKFGTYGSPWEFNLRDTLRWLQLLTTTNGLSPSGNARDFLDTIFTQRFRNESDRTHLVDLFHATYGAQQARKSYYHNLGLGTIQVGLGFLPRNNRLAPCKETQILQRSRYAAAESLMICAQQNWPVILVGPPGAGKSSLINHIAGATGATLVTFAMNADIDAMDLVGGFEQVDPVRQIHRYFTKLKSFVQSRLVEDQTSQASLYYLTILMHINTSITCVSSELFSLLEMAAREDSQCVPLFEEINYLQSSSQGIDGGRFQWVDGVLVQALEEGSWLVLDNANLCSASVLDRLNSLLEPNGYLSINEHPTEDGEARIVKPHPNFRVIMTMDPRYGELSRAMRNRAVEIFLLPDWSSELQPQSQYTIAYPMESSMYRFRHFTTHTTEQPSLPPLNIWIPKAKEIYTKIATEAGLGWNFANSQPYHPLNNEVVVYRNTGLTDAAIGASFIYDFVVEIERMKSALNDMTTQSFGRWPEKNRIPEFLLALWQALSTWLEQVWQAETLNFPFLDSLNRIRALFWELYNMSIAVGFDRAALHTYLAMFTNVSTSLKQLDHPAALMSNAIATSLTGLRSGSHLSSGLCMELVWSRFKPTTSTSTPALDTLLKLEALADRFDTIMWRSDVSFDDLARTRETFSSAIGLLQEVNVDGEELATSLENGVHELEQKVVEDDYQITPYFEQAFEGICQFLDLVSSDNSGLSYQSRASRSKASLLARRSTKSAMSPTGNTPCLLFLDLCNYLRARDSGNKDIALSNQFQAVALDKLTHVESVSLRQLDSFESELHLLGQLIGSESESLAQNQLLTLKDHLGALTAELAGIFEAFTSDDRLGDTRSQSFISTNLRQCLEYSRLAEEDLSSLTTASKAWTSLALAGIKLYIPDRPFDPALRPMIERRFFNDHKAGIEERLDALQLFEQRFTGNDTTLRIRLVQQALQTLGEEPQVAAVVRPDVSELEVLQGELDNLLNVVRPLLEGTATAEDISQDHTFRQNISHIIRRLTEGYRYYDDITGPAVGFLLCLNIGLSLAAQSHLARTPSSEAVAYLSAQTPFLGLSRHEIQATASFYEADLGNTLKQKHPDTDLRWHFLQHRAIDVAIMAPFGRYELHNLTHDVFSSFFTEWKERLQLDQEKEAADHSLYTYRGGDDEDIDEGDLSLFPDYEMEVDDSALLPSRLSQDLVVRLSDLHEKIFLGNDSGPEMAKDLLHWSAKEIGKLTKRDTACASKSSLEDMLPAIFVEIDRGINTLSTGGVAQTYNFYFDPNIVEGKRFINLIHKLQNRYRKIREVWPEHATLGEVLRTCDEALAFGHIEPVAKFLTKAEKLHSYMYEWQRVASREFSTSALYDELTNLLISWRRLELTTWARLFDIEMEKCNNAAKSWWFIAYETIVAAPESLQSSNEAVQSHAKGLLKALEGFFSSTTIGQFNQRLRLLKQFSNHVKLRVQEVPSLQPIHLALENFISYYSKFKTPVQETLAKGRKVLEKQIKEVILLASWKDTNIEALKQSAKTSHRKLTKLVRKFRTLLNQSFAGVLSKGFPDLGGLPPIQSNPEVVMAHVDNAMLDRICSGHISDWNSRQSRFKNVPVTVSIMRSKSRPNPSSLNASEHVNDFIAELESSMAELQKATPAYLTEENKTAVKHLKSRKRKLFVDTLKTLKEMGFKWNFGTDALENQDSLATVLARLPALPTTTSGDTETAAENHLYQTLSIMQQVREIAKEHPGDLTGEQVARAIGFLESLLQSSIRQRTTLARTVETSQSPSSDLSMYQALQDPISRIAHLGAPDERDLLRTSDGQVKDAKSLLNVVQWLVAILAVGIDLINTQAKLAKLDLSSITTGLATWKITFDNLLSETNGLLDLPENVWTRDHIRVNESVGQRLLSFESDVKKWVEDFPVVKCTLKQILPFVRFESASSLGEIDQATYITVEDMSHQIFSTIDNILGSMQDVESALANLPLSPEDSAWFIKEETTLFKTINAMQVPLIARELQGLADSIQRVQDIDTTNSGIKTVVAVFASVLPILQQYHAIFLELMNRYAALHASTCKLSYRLAKVFLQVGTKGFCTPSEKSDEKGDKSDKLEDGTGLGDGEGAEDISKDIGDDEDLTDLAQQESEKKDNENIEDEEDAVDMGEQEMEGEMGDVEHKEDDEDSSEKSEGDVESEVGDVDELGPSTVDEKMWDEGSDEAEKDRDGDDGKGQKNDEQVAAGEKDGEKEEEEGEGQEDEDMEPEEGAEEQENVGMEENEKMDPHTEQGETLDLPDELNMDDENEKDAKASDDDILGDMDDEGVEEEMDAEEGAPEPDDVDPDIKEDEADGSTTGHIEDEAEHLEDQSEGPEDMDEAVAPLPDDQPMPDDSRPTEDEATADTSAEAGAGMDAQDDVQNDQDASANAAKRDEGTKGEASDPNDQATAEEGETGRTNPDSAGRGDDVPESAASQPFKKLGDTLEKWYNQQRQIQDATQKDDKQVQQTEKEVDMADADFEHLEDEETEADAQALGTATEEQAKTLDKSMALPTDENEERIPALPEDKPDDEANEDVDMVDTVDDTPRDQQPQDGDGRPKAFVGEQKPIHQEDEDQEMEDAPEDLDDDSDVASSVSEVENQLSLTHLDVNSDFPTVETARALWLHHESTTHSLAQTLTEHLRLILAPTLATKLRGDFRTGKRLNLKRIIPYIASGYKRDKIWLRRSQPSKRAYQILVALDDSRSMAESGAANLALKTLALITRSLAMLEVGEVAVVGFGDDVKVAHDFDKPFTSDAGANVFQQFGFGQQKTDVRKLVERSLGLFEEARMRGQGRGDDLWQLMLVVSDGICDGHAEIQRLVRKAQENRVMIVFVVVDATATSGDGEDGAGAKGLKKGKEKQSVLDLKSVEFGADGKMVITRYMDRFPFRWYLVVRDVADLPGVLATALRQWFAEVVDASG
ncbi:midasin [Mytilinidion resinicola]|uniref:Midasin n=1 Tax=Mytilinidion resinicola TaxID=574789 RepID=A0A6A6Y5S4_9PEZI|nr:midasin [Mytilinidion resinicola]KAF2804010.1 midasin [Mytilinidion resinicola]